MSNFYKEPSKNNKLNMSDSEFINRVNNKDTGKITPEKVVGARDNESTLNNLKPKPLNLK